MTPPRKKLIEAQPSQRGEERNMRAKNKDHRYSPIIMVW